MLNSYHPTSCPILTYAILPHTSLLFYVLCTAGLVDLTRHIKERTSMLADCALFTLYGDIFRHQLQLAVTLACLQPTNGSWVSKTYWFSKNCSGKLCLKQWANASQTLWHSAVWPVLRKIRQLLQPGRWRLLTRTQDTRGISLEGGSSWKQSEA